MAPQHQAKRRTLLPLRSYVDIPRSDSDLRQRPRELPSKPAPASPPASLEATRLAQQSAFRRYQDRSEIHGEGRCPST